MLKKDIRKEYNEKRLGLSLSDAEQLGRQICRHFSGLKFSDIRILLSYYPIPERREFDVRHCEKLLSDNHPGLQIAWPRLEADMMTMDAILINADSRFSKNRFNILEPQADRTI